jgi:uncharacterized DUF497 family protein
MIVKYMYSVNMKIKFEWDETKNTGNKKKHGISFEEASTIFLNFPVEVYFDPENSAFEDRYIAIGFSNKSRLLIVVHCENSKGTVVRIISARKATRREQRSVFGDRK